MKYVSKVFTFLLLAALPGSLLAQNSTIILEFMKVTQESEATYLEVEKAWKNIHAKKVKEGYSMGWQLWRNRYAAYGDDYQYVTINRYKDFTHSCTPMHEEAIKRGYKANWSVWGTYPYKEGQATYAAVDGFISVEQFTGGMREDLLTIVHPDKTWDEINEMLDKTRKVVSIEVWELVESVSPEE